MLYLADQESMVSEDRESGPRRVDVRMMEVGDGELGPAWKRETVNTCHRETETATREVWGPNGQRAASI